MRRLTRRNRSTSRLTGQQDDATTSSACLPESLLCRRLPLLSPSAVDVSPARVAGWSSPRSTAVHSGDRRTSEDMAQQINKNGVADGVELSGNGLKHYDRFIATLLRERSLVKDGIPPTADDRRKHPLNIRRSLNTRLRKRLPLRAKIEDKPRINGSGNDCSLAEVTDMMRKPVDDQLLLLKLAGVEVSSSTANTGNGIVTSSVHIRQPRAEVDFSRSTVEATLADVALDTSSKFVERSKRRRRYMRKKSPRQGAGLNGSFDVRRRSDGSDTAALYAPLSRRRAPENSDDSKTELATDFDEVLNRHQDVDDSSCTFRARSGGRNAVTTHNQNRDKSTRSAAAVSGNYPPRLPPRTDKAMVERRHGGGGLDDQCEKERDIGHFQSFVRVDYETSRRSATTDFSNFERELPTHTDKAADRRHKDDVFGLTVRASTIEFIDIDEQTGEPFNNDEDETALPACINHVDRASSSNSLMADRRINDECEPTSLSLRADSLQFGCHVIEMRVRRDFQRCRCADVCSRWSQRGAPAAPYRRCRSQPSLSRREVAKPVGRPTRPSQLLEKCRCSISAATDNADDDDEMRRQQQQQPTRDLQLIDNVKQSSNERPQQRVRHAANLPSNDVSWRPRSSRRDRSTDDVIFNRRMFCVARQNDRRGGRPSRCSLIIEFVRTHLQTEDRKTTLIFTQRTAAESRDLLVVDSKCDSLNLPFCASSTCKIHDAANDKNEQVDRTAEQSVTLSQPSSVVSVADVFQELNHPWTVRVGDVVHRNDDDVSRSLTVYEFAEVTSVFRNFADDLLPTTNSGLPLVPARRPRDGATSTALVRRACPGITHSGAVVPYRQPRPLLVLLPIMTWTWNQDHFAGSQPRLRNDDVVHIPYVSACTTVNVEPPIDRFTLIVPSPNAC